MNDPTSFADRNVIVKLTLRAFRSRRKDRKATADLAVEKSAEATQIAVLKTLLPEGTFEPVYKHDRDTYEMFNKSTLPWLDGSEDEADTASSGEGRPVPIGRICRTSVFPEIMEAMKVRRLEREPLVADGLARYADLLAQPELLEAKLGGLYRREDYPPVEKVRGAFKFAVRIFQVPQDDWRVQLAGDELEEVRALAARQREEAAANAQKCLVEQIAIPLGKVRDMLLKPDGERRILQSTLDAVHEIGNRIKGLNVTGHPVFDEIQQAIGYEMAYGADSLREHAGRRSRVASAAQQLLDKMAQLTSDEPAPEVFADSEPAPAPEPAPVMFTAPTPLATPADELLALAGAF